MKSSVEHLTKSLKQLENQHISHPVQKTNCNTEKKIRKKLKLEVILTPEQKPRFESLFKSMMKIVWLDQPTKKRKTIMRKLTCFKKQLSSFIKAVVIIEKSCFSAMFCINSCNCNCYKLLCKLNYTD